MAPWAEEQASAKNTRPKGPSYKKRNFKAGASGLCGYIILRELPNYKFGTQVLTAPFGLAPRDFEVLLGLFGYWRNLDERPQDHCLDLTTSFIARQYTRSKRTHSTILSQPIDAAQNEEDRYPVPAIT